ncbi:DNA polymerase I [Granulicella mallensis]|uniref:DNA polymerase I n=1 Tax=Granulicella mallensis TaxID=940614 RepID=A0A7W8E9J4_9BACT|nr:DNA polymerase I [Granulicella mallensis]MBB5063766.1 DNA polymerase-1 [Granulicella mallensis]
MQTKEEIAMPNKTDKPPIYLLDSMAFIFRAYHAMQRSRPMSTRTGIPTAATYVFVNMINKLRKDFQPQYLAAVYDVGAPLLRNEQAKQMKDVQKFNIKTQEFETIEYGGYKANRAETPPDLIQQQPYIRRALEAFRIPILFYEGFEADDVIGTLSCQLSALGHHVYVVSSDKDMMQLVNENVSILNPMKDNLILDPAGVENVLGVPPAHVVDVMALRGDAIDNIPGAPGIGDKGSVELIQQFGTVEGALDRAAEVKKKTYRESLQNNRDNILLSKELVTIHTAVPIEFSLDHMRTQPVDNAACRALFTELEFTTMLKELAPDVDATPVTYNIKATTDDLAKLLAEAREPSLVARDLEAHSSITNQLPRGLAIALAETTQAIAEEVAADASANAEVEESEPEPPQTMSLFGADEGSGPRAQGSEDSSSEPGGLNPEPSQDPACRLGLAVTAGHAIEVSLDTPGIREALADPALPKQVHDLKAVLRALQPHDITLAGPITDVMLQSYLLNPTHSSHTLIDLAARTTSRALTHQPTKDNPNDPKRLPEAAAAIARLAVTLGEQLAEVPTTHVIPKDDPALGGAITTEMLFADKAQGAGPRAQGPASASSGRRALNPETSPLNEHSTLSEVYEQLDLPLVSVLLQMEQTGVRVDSNLLREMSSRLAVTIDDLAERIYASSGHRFNINSPKQLGDVLFNKMDLPKPTKHGKGKVISTAQDILEDLAQHHEVPAIVLEYRQLQKLKSTYLDQLPSLTDANGRIHTTFNQVGTATGRLSSINPNLQNIPIRTAVGREIRAAFIAAPGNLLMSADYSQIELRLMAHFSQDPLLLDAYRTGKDIHTLTAAEVFEVDAATMDKETRARAKAVNFGIVYGISPFGLAAQLGIDQKVAKAYIERYFDRYKGVATFIEQTLETVRRDQAVKTAFGRVRPIPDIQSRNPNQRGFAERTAVNTPLQGTAADLIKIAMLRIDAAIRMRNLRSLMTLQVHDELLFDVVPEEADEMQELVKTEMESAAEFSVPIVAEVGLGDNWRDIK